MPQWASRAALGAAAFLGDLAHRPEVAVGQRGGHPHRGGVPGAEADHDQARVGQPLEHEWPSGEQEVEALGE